MIIHREQKGLKDGICVDCYFFYECNVRVNAETRGNSVTECTAFTLDNPQIIVTGGDFGGNKWHDVKTGEVREVKE